MIDHSVTSLIARVSAGAAAYRRATTIRQRADAAPCLLDAEQLIRQLRLRAYECSTDADDRLEQVVFDVHGVEVSVRGREGDMFVHVDDERDDDDRRAHPLCVEVNESGENYYGDPDVY